MRRFGQLLVQLLVQLYGNPDTSAKNDTDVGRSDGRKERDRDIVDKCSQEGTMVMSGETKFGSAEEQPNEGEQQFVLVYGIQ